MNSKSKGKYGEDLAVSYLENKGFEIIERNFRYHRSEIDLIGLLNNKLLVFFEVKLRKSDSFGEPEIFVTQNQQQKIMQAADEYIHGINWDGAVRFDIIAIKGAHLEHIEDGFS